MLNNQELKDLENKKLELELSIKELLQKEDYSKDLENELRSELLYINKQIKHKLGNKEIKIQEEIKRKRTGKDERNINNYNILKNKYKQISNIEIATKDIIRNIDNYYLSQAYEDNMEMVKRI